MQPARHRASPSRRRNVSRRRPPRALPREPAVLGDTLFFTANDGIHGRELWRSDGTDAGTEMVKNIKPNDAARRPGSAPSGITAVDDTLFFSADDGTRGRELWKSDGTEAGTALVKNIHPSASGRSTRDPPPREVGSSSPLTTEPTARSCGSPTAAEQAQCWSRTSRPGGRRTTYGSPHYLTARGNRVFFAANDGPHGVELWRSNGTRTGTVMVRNIDTNERNDDPDYPGSMPRDLTTVGGTCTSLPGTTSTARSCGSRTALGPARSWSRTSTRGSGEADRPSG